MASWQLRGVHGIPAAVRHDVRDMGHGDIADTHTAPSHTDAKRRQQRSEPSTLSFNRILHRPGRTQSVTHDTVRHIMLITTFTNLRQRILSSLESLRKLQELT